VSDVLDDGLLIPSCIGTALVHQELYIETAKLARAEDLTLQVLNQGHWKIYGKGVTVNYYAISKNQTAHVDGTKGGVMRCTPWDAVQLALRTPDKKDMQPRYKRPGRSRHKPVTLAPTSSIQKPETQGAPPWEQ
jgi:hypothetical protein